MPTFNHAQATLHYEVQGEGSAVVLIHGLGSSALDWEYQLPALRHFRVITLDLRGHGRSSRAPVPISMKLFSDDVAALLDHLKIPVAQIVGLSLGGGIAFQFALDHADKVRSLTIVNSGPHAVMDTFAARLVIGLRFLVLRLFGLDKLAAMVAGKLFPKPEHRQKKQTFIERFHGNDKESYRASLKALLGWTVQERLGDIRKPVLVVAADQDYTPVSWKEDYVKRMPDAKLVVIPDSRHAMPIENPEPFNQVLNEFLGRHI